MSNRVDFTPVNASVEYLKKVKNYVDTGMETVIDVSQDLVEDGYGNNQNVDELKDVMLQYANMDNKLDAVFAAVDVTRIQGSGKGECKDLIKIFDEKLEELLERNKGTDLKQHEKFTEMEEKIWEIEHPGENPSQQLISTRVIADDDLILTQQEVSTKCPYLGRDMTHPMKNKICGHHIDKEALDALLRVRKGSKCPFGGCGNTELIQQDTYHEDKELKKFIDRKKRAAGKRK